MNKGQDSLENELRQSLSKMEHRVEMLLAISHRQESSGYHELAQAYKKQARELKAYA